MANVVVVTSGKGGVGDHHRKWCGLCLWTAAYDRDQIQRGEKRSLVPRHGLLSP